MLSLFLFLSSSISTPLGSRIILFPPLPVLVIFDNAPVRVASLVPRRGVTTITVAAGRARRLDTEIKWLLHMCIVEYVMSPFMSM